MYSGSLNILTSVVWFFLALVCFRFIWYELSHFLHLSSIGLFDHIHMYCSSRTPTQPLPPATPIQTELPNELFGDAIMLLEFLNNFGPLFNIREVIRGGITFGEECVCERVCRCTWMAEGGSMTLFCLS